MAGSMDFSLSSLAFNPSAVDFSLKAMADKDGIDVAAKESDGIDNELYTRPRIYSNNVTRPVLYEHAADMVDAMELEDGMRAFAIVSGNFVFGDVLEAWVLEKGIRFKTLTIQTLSMSQENIDSLRRIRNVHGDRLRRLRIALSDYFYSHERKVREGRNTPALVPYLYRTLDDGDGVLDVAYASVHTKIITFETTDGLKCVVDGSANLRSSRNLEQFRVECDAELFDWIEGFTDRIFDAYSTMGKSVRGGKLWQSVRQQAR
ncbi:MAG: hypothetical protein IKG21_13125 [Atopobiaceae bacterium]|nr:hypothetical protein [Atopobiaceae bacterium]